MKEIALHIMDIAQNSVRAGADRITITLNESPADDTLTLTIADNGSGMDQESCRKVTDPWFTSRTTRKVGMGLPLLQMKADGAGGAMTIDSEKGRGTTVTASFIHSHIDRPPLGDVSGTAALLIISNPTIDITYKHLWGKREWSISTEEIKRELGEDALTDLSIVRALKEIINESIKELRKDVARHDKY